MRPYYVQIISTSAFIHIHRIVCVTTLLDPCFDLIGGKLMCSTKETDFGNLLTSIAINQNIPIAVTLSAQRKIVIIPDFGSRVLK